MRYIHDSGKSFYLDEAIKYLNYINVNTDLYTDTYEYNDGLILEYQTKEKYQIRHGASKIVIIFDKKDWVIKIPLIGERRNEDNDYSNSYSCDDDCENCSHTCEMQHIENVIDYFPYEGAINLKVGATIESTLGWDYCKVEELIWQIAEEYNLDNMFLRTMQIGEYKGIPIYIQEKADEVSLQSKKEYPSQKSIYSFLNINSYELTDNFFGGKLIEFYGEEKTKNFIDFIDEFNITDLHANNFGFWGNRPVLIDYSGFSG